MRPLVPQNHPREALIVSTTALPAKAISTKAFLILWIVAVCKASQSFESYEVFFSYRVVTMIPMASQWSVLMHVPRDDFVR